MAGKNTLFSSKLACTFLLAVGVSTGAWAAAKTGFSNHNSKDPIQFSADRLEVQKEGRVARFLGKVEAIQGDMTLLSDEVRVYYQQDDKKKQGEESSSLTGSVNRIDSRGNVRVTSRGDTAEGDWAAASLMTDVSCTRNPLTPRGHRSGWSHHLSRGPG